MHIFSEKRGRTMRVRLIGELDHHAAHEARDKLDQLLEPDIDELLLDLAWLTFMDSSGIGVLIGRYKILSGRGGSITVTKVNPQVDRIIRMAGLYNILRRA